MKDLFMELLTNLQAHGTLTAASLYKDDTYSTITVESEDAVYSVSISKEKKER